MFKEEMENYLKFWQNLLSKKVLKSDLIQK